MILGIIHLLHCPCLILLPFWINNHIFDIIYIEYFFSIMFLYTFINGECPISYIYKKRKDPMYIAGNRITYYPEMLHIACFSKQNQIQLYFKITTIFYLGTLIHVIHRNNIPITMFTIPTSSLLVYFSLNHHHPLFYIIQNVNKTILFFFILCLIRREIYI